MLNGEVAQGLNALGYLYGYNSNATAERLADKTGSTPDMMSRIMGKLARAGYVSVKRGPFGGYYMKDIQCETKVIDIVNVLGQTIYRNDGYRASDFVNRALFDALDVKLCIMIGDEV